MPEGVLAIYIYMGKNGTGYILQLQLPTYNEIDKTYGDVKF